MKHTLLILIAGLVALASGMLVRNLNNISTEKVSVTADLFSTQLPDLQGTSHALSQWRGKILVINFWATWCPPCLHEIPDFMTMQTDYAAKNVQFIGIALDEQQAVLDYTTKIGINYPILLGGNQGMGLARQWGNLIESVPFTVVVNAQGTIVHRQLGEMSASELQAILQPLLGKNI